MTISRLIVTTVSLIGCCLLGDSLMERSNGPLYVRALIDNLTHAAVGAFSWLLVSELTRKSDCFEILLCAFLSSALDVDHFWEAKSFKLKDAVNLNRRPPFHNISLGIVVFLIQLIISCLLHSSRFYKLAWITLTAWISHNLRDGVRRGLWFWPIGSTEPLPYSMYIFLLCILPYLVYLGFLPTMKDPSKIEIISV